MLIHAPRVLPSLQLILDDLGRPPPLQVARVLGVHARTVTRWIAQDRMPRASALALFWLTRYGRSVVDCAAVNEARLYAALAANHASQVERLGEQLHRLMQLADFGSANDPLRA